MPRPAVFTRLVHLGVVGVVGLVATAGVGCGNIDGDLVAPDGAHRMVATDPATGVNVVLTTASWPGDPALESDLTIVHVLVSNTGRNRVRLAPGDFEMRDGRGFRYDLRDAGGRFRRAGARDRGYAPGLSDRFYPVDDPSGQLARDALPWGVLEPGTSMRGFVYFERMERRASLATMVWHATDAQGRALADMKFSLAVAR